MTPEAFVSKWSQTTTKERAAAQEHFIDLCRVLNEKTPNEADPLGEWYAFEKGVQKTGAGKGWADVWKRSCFGWEYKGKGKNLREALKQLQLYALALESPPLLIVCDLEIIEIHTAFQNAVQEVHVIELQDLLDPTKLQLLKWAFAEPERLRPTRTRNEITEHAASQFASLAFQLRDDGHDPHTVAHFLNKLLFCMFAEDAGLLPKDLFIRLLETGVEAPEHFDTTLRRLFAVMSEGGPFGVEMVSWFNGGLFDSDETLPLTGEQVRLVLLLAYMDWSQIEPSIFGTLFERGLDPDKRSQLGAHYTDAESIMRLVTPTITEPLLTEWEESKKQIVRYLEQLEKVTTKRAKQQNLRRAENEFQTYLERLRTFRVLDPACGSGNFLYLALRTLKDLEHRANVEAEALGLLRQNPLVGPASVLGIEINAYAAELARVTVWIGEIQWMLQHGYQPHKDPILKPLSTIEQRDAILGEDGQPSAWPDVDVIIGNPPFLGNKKLISELGESYVASLRKCYSGRLSDGVDLVMYWYEQSKRSLKEGRAERVGLVATNSIRAGTNRTVLAGLFETHPAFCAWSDEPWVNDGAAVRVSLICFGGESDVQVRLNSEFVERILPDLTSSISDSGTALDFTQTHRIPANRGLAFQGPVKVGKFEISGDLARNWLTQPNPNKRPNSDVLKPWVNGNDLTKSRPTGKWIIDYGVDMPEVEASLYELPFEYLVAEVHPQRQAQRDASRKKYWWRHGRTGNGMRKALDGQNRYIATPRVSRHRVFVWLDHSIWPDSRILAIAREDDVTMGILQSRVHELWTLKTCSWHGKGNDPTYNGQSVFETFPFPEEFLLSKSPDQFSSDVALGIADASRNLMQLRENWLNPTDWIDCMDEVVPGFPRRVMPKRGFEVDLRQRTLTNLYTLMHPGLRRPM